MIVNLTPDPIAFKLQTGGIKIIPPHGNVAYVKNFRRNLGQVDDVAYDEKYYDSVEYLPGGMQGGDFTGTRKKLKLPPNVKLIQDEDEDEDIPSILYLVSEEVLRHCQGLRNDVAVPDKPFKDEKGNTIYESVSIICEGR